MSSLLILRVCFVTNIILLQKIYTDQTVLGRRKEEFRRRGAGGRRLGDLVVPVHTKEHSEGLRQIVEIKFFSESLMGIKDTIKICSPENVLHIKRLR